MDLWNCENPIIDMGIDVPDWIQQDITPYDIAAIVQGGCASGAYMPAVTYSDALETMKTYGDEIMYYLAEQHGEVPAPPAGETWDGLACFYVSAAVESWANEIEPELSAMEEPAEITDGDYIITPAGPLGSLQQVSQNGNVLGEFPEREDAEMNIDDIKRRNRESGGHFFDRDTVSFFRSQTLSTVYEGRGGVFFVTSEQFDQQSPRRFTVRKFDDNGNIGTFGPFNSLSHQSAVLLARRAADGEISEAVADNLGDNYGN